MRTADNRLKVLGEQIIDDDTEVDVAYGAAPAQPSIHPSVVATLDQQSKSIAELQQAVNALVHKISQPAPKADNSQGELVLTLLARATQILSERVAMALGAGLLPLIAVIGGIWLWRPAMVTPNEFQLAGLGIYGLLVILPTLFYRRRP